MPDRRAIDSARHAAFDATNEYLARRRAERAPRRPSDRPNGKILHQMRGFQFFTSLEGAISEVTEAIMNDDGASGPGRELNADEVQVREPARFERGSGAQLKVAPPWAR